MKQTAGTRLRGTVALPGDKSIAHRAAFLASIARGKSIIEHFPNGADCQRTLDLLEAIGVPVERDSDRVSVSGEGYFGFRPPSSTLDAGNSGTTLRMACGLLSPQPFDSRLTGDESLRLRPMRRVIEPLGQMGAAIESSAEGRAPLAIRGGRTLKGIHYRLPIASAQVKTAILLAGLHAEGETHVQEPFPSRNHTELALERFGAVVGIGKDGVRVRGGGALRSTRMRLPGDISSAAFFIVGAAILPGSSLVVSEVGLNPTRTAFLEVLQSMGARITIEEEQEIDGEIAGTVRVEDSELTGVDVSAERVPGLIDEIPALAVAASFAQGETIIRGASELRVKESDRIRAMATGLRAMNVDVEELPDGLRVKGGRPMRAASLDSFGDHRIAMAWGVASLGVDGTCQINGKDAASVSFPGFWETLGQAVA
jgi:3-phosphoshikimate 1-carboxyvinyltransferase